MIQWQEILFDQFGRPKPPLRLLLKKIKVPDGPLYVVNEAFQRRFFQKDSHGQPLERWELNLVDSLPLQELWPDLKALCMIDAVRATQKHYEGALVFGGLVKRVRARIIDLANEWTAGVRFNRIVLLGSARKLLKKQKEGPPGPEQTKLLFQESDDFPIRDDFCIPTSSCSLATEYDMMRLQWGICAAIPEEMRHLSIDEIKAPYKSEEGRQVRPTTADTLNLWETGCHPPDGQYLASSGMPYAGPQHIQAVMTLDKRLKVETIGRAIKPDLSIEAILRELAGWIYQHKRLFDSQSHKK